MKRILLFFIALCTAMIMSGQNQLPNDPAVKKGRLENGLTYYIRHNDKPADRAEFYLATNVGAIQETPDQDGLAHFLEHMCFNGTKNFPGKGILNYLQGIGAEFGRNINASTGFEQTVYMLNNIPLVREGVIDSCLLILHDYSHYVTCDPAEIDKERGVIIEERRTRRNADWRMFEKSLPYMYGDSKYATCTLIGSQENLENFKPESLTNFYHTWYRPDLQAVIVVGDVDVQEIEDKIKATFGSIPAAENPQPKEAYKVPDNVEPVVGIITDPEARNTSIEVMWKSEPMPEELNSTDVGMMTSLVKAYIGTIMYERFNDITSKPGAPFLGAHLGIGSLCETLDVVMGNISCKDSEGISAFTAFMTEVEKMKRYGFTDDEVARAKDNILSSYEKQVEGADSRKNADFIDSYVDNFFDNFPYMEPKTEYEVAKMICSQLNAAMLNQIAAALITDDNLVIIYKAPEKEGLVHPTEDDFLKAISDVKNADIKPNESVDTNEPLLDAAALKGAKVKKSAEVTVGGKKVTEWYLKNGVKVVVLPTTYKKDQVIMDLVKDGGRSLIATEDLDSFDDNVFGLFMRNTGLSRFEGTTLSKMLAGKNVSTNVYVGSIRHGISANSSPKDLETAFQLMYLTVAEPRFDENEFQTGIDQLKAILPNMLNQPGFKFQAAMTETLYGDNPRRSVINMSTLEKANLTTIERVYREQLFNGVAGATLYITGNVKLDELKPLVEKYIGSLPKGKKTEWKNTGESIVKGKVENHFAVNMETPKSTVFQVHSAYIPYSVKEEVMLDAAKYILDMIYTETLREDEGGTYGAGVATAIQKYPEERALIQVYFDTNPESADKLRKLAVDGLMKLMNDGPTEEQLTRTIENFKKNIPENKINNGWWMNAMKSYYNYDGLDYSKEYEAAVKAISSDNIKNALKAVVDQNNFIEVMMSPAE